MSEISVGARDIPVRGLTRNELKGLINSGLNPSVLDMANADGCMDKIFSLVLTEDDIQFLGDLCNSEAVRVFRSILELTYGREDEIKN